MHHWTKWLWVAILTIVGLSGLLFSFNLPITNGTALNTRTEEFNDTYPRLFATKVVETTEVFLNETFVVTVTIGNFGNQTAYNVTFIDRINNPWVFEIIGLTTLSYSQIGVNETRQFSYLVTTKSLGTYNLFSAQVEYYTSELNPTKFVTITNDIEIIVIEPPEDFSLANFNIAITLIIVLVILDVMLLARLIAPKLSRRSRND